MASEICNENLGPLINIIIRSKTPRSLNLSRHRTQAPLPHVEGKQKFEFLHCLLEATAYLCPALSAHFLVFPHQLVEVVKLSLVKKNAWILRFL
jgi:hypothetical protein